MPWVKNGREKKFVHPPYTEPQVLGKDLPPSGSSGSASITSRILMPCARSSSGASSTRSVRASPAGATANARAQQWACHDEALDWLKEHFYKPFKELSKGK